MVAATAHQVLLGSGYPTFLLLPPRTCLRLLSSWLFLTTGLGSPPVPTLEAQAGPRSPLPFAASHLSVAAFSTEHPDQLPEAASGHSEGSRGALGEPWGQPPVVGLRNKGAQIAGHSDTGPVIRCPGGRQLYPPAASATATHGDSASQLVDPRPQTLRPQAHSQGPHPLSALVP